MRKIRHPIANIQPIAKISSLASLLSVSEADLIDIIDNIESFHRPGKLLKKKNGELRPTHDARSELKIIHARIKNRILKKVQFPYYLQGGIADKTNPRSCKGHAKIHAGTKIIICEDIANFYPSTSYKTVLKIWKLFFNFSNDVAEILTRLTTYRGALPQGWKTSSYIANIAFWHCEPDLVKILEEKGFSYSRYIDDITVGSKLYISNNEKEFIVSSVYGMLFSKGYKPKREKQEIVSSEKPMTVTSLNVNSQMPTIPKKLRNNVRTMVYQLEKSFISIGNTIEYKKRWHSINGKVCRVKSFHLKEGGKLQERMRQIKPIK
ncbi:TPA: RNA-directed DNA polymerase [Legionella pneumophila]|nr:RNA-directed DNA polymerase [Legionella pneumophila]